MQTQEASHDREIHSSYAHLCFQKRWRLSEAYFFLLGESNALIKAIKNTPILPAFRKHLYNVALIRGARATTAIEGNTLTEEEIRALREGQAELPESREYLKKEVDNVIEALNTILIEVINERDVLITPELIRRYHRMIGEGIGDAFTAIPGEFRRNNVTVGPYRAPHFEEVPDLIQRLCDWLRREFHYEGGQSFIDAAIQAVVTHVYIAWIHPFSDGNGRTARLIEFFLLVRAGVPDIASHVLSNHYNLTRSEYYRHIDQSMRDNDLTGFLMYAIQGFRDGLQNVLDVIQENQRRITWNNYIYEIYNRWIDKDNKQRPAAKRKRNLIRRMPTDQWMTIEAILNLHSSILKAYGGDETNKTLLRDIADLVKDELLVKKKKEYKANIEILREFMAQSAID